MASPSDIVLASSVRTPIGRFGGAFKDLKATELGAIAVRESLSRVGLAPNLVDEVILGQVVQAGAGQNPARQAALKAGLPDSVAALTVNKVCGSSLKAVALAANAIKAGEAEIILAGGMESMSGAPYLVPKARFGYKYGDATFVDALYHDGLMDAYSQVAMGETGEVVAEEFHVTRQQADAFAAQSHKRAAHATAAGWFKDEIVPVEVASGKTKTVVTADEGIRPDTTPETLAKLKGAFRPDGMVTAGNASQMSDGASALLVASRKAAQEHGLEIQARLVGFTTAGVAPMRVMAAPIPSVQKLLQKTGHRIEDVDLVEHNEAFATASCAVMSALHVPAEKLNVSGGAVALGHPLGASGARVLTTLLHNLKRTGKQRGLATLCLGGGNAVSAMVERE
ncbi:MAG: acetyl-CoA C-acetyltransferase [Thermoplasmata archaeon]|jgi:acetyl-CoA C-acetyltransferase|nr:acetyl-CoA C-acetyltransferase [Thermoplasmata archaeon]